GEAHGDDARRACVFADLRDIRSDDIHAAAASGACGWSQPGLFAHWVHCSWLACPERAPSWLRVSADPGRQVHWRVRPVVYWGGVPEPRRMAKSPRGALLLCRCVRLLFPGDPGN